MPTIKTKCDHEFHAHCGYNWWKTNTNCPSCRRDVDTLFNALAIRDLTDWESLQESMTTVIEETDFEDAATCKCRKDSKGRFFLFQLYLRNARTNELDRIGSPYRFWLRSVRDKKVTAIIEDHCKEMDIAVKTVEFATVERKATVLSAPVTLPSPSILCTSDQFENTGINNGRATFADSAMIALVRTLYRRTIEVQYNRYMGKVKGVRFITMNDEYVFNLGGEKLKSLENLVKTFNSNVTFKSDTTGNPHKGGKGGRGDGSWD